MKHVNYQTVRLTKGKHTSPLHGACVMELASMLAGEPFSDHPRSVSPAIAAFLRLYNDFLDEKRRQDLYAYASKAVGTAGPPDLERLRAERLVEWGDRMWERRIRWSPLDRLRYGRERRKRHEGAEPAARYAFKAIRRISGKTHRAVLALVDELISIDVYGESTRAAAERDSGQATTWTHAQLDGAA